MKNEKVFVVMDIWLFGKMLHNVYADEIDALREATKPNLPQGVLRREVVPKVVL